MFQHLTSKERFSRNDPFDLVILQIRIKLASLKDIASQDYYYMSPVQDY